MDKHLAIALCCFCRQAERSIDRVNGGAVPRSYLTMWQGLVEYYDNAKRAGLDWALDRLKSIDAHRHKPVSRAHVFTGTFTSWLTASIARLIRMPLSTWFFADHELA